NPAERYAPAPPLRGGGPFRRLRPRSSRGRGTARDRGRSSARVRGRRRAMEPGAPPALGGQSLPHEHVPGLRRAPRLVLRRLLERREGDPRQDAGRTRVHVDRDRRGAAGLARDAGGGPADPRGRQAPLHRGQRAPDAGRRPPRDRGGVRRGTPDRSRRWLRLRRIGASRVAPPPRDDRPFELTAEALVGLEPGLGKPPVYLGHFTRHGVELLLEQSGFLDQLRARGFRRLRVDLDPSQGIGQTLRAVCEDRPEGELLVELRVDRSLATVPGHEVLDIEWLLLQNPRESFTERRPALPVPQKPGTGLLLAARCRLVAAC